jgi:hypothetical protein
MADDAQDSLAALGKVYADETGLMDTIISEKAGLSSE